MTEKMVLAGGNKCPICGKVFTAEAPLKPNVENREFYGGRVHFFKDVDCDCTAKYRLCIEKRFNPVKVAEEFNVINMIVLKAGDPAEEPKKKTFEKVKEEKTEQVVEETLEAALSGERFPSLAERKEERKQAILATIADKDEKIQTLMNFTTKELQTMCRRRRLKFNKKDNKSKLAETLLAYDEALVVANPED